MLQQSRRDCDAVRVGARERRHRRARPRSARPRRVGRRATGPCLHGAGRARGAPLSRLAPDLGAGRIGFAGASLGANLAALAAAEDPTVASLALLSPSLDYRGLRIEPAIRKIGSRPILLVASDDDGYASRTVRDLQKAGNGIREPLILSKPDTVRRCSRATRI